jgi:hypothetical protein
LFDLHGRLVATLLNGVVSAGDHEITFNGIDGQGRILTAGLYVCEMSAGLQSTIHQTALLKVR